MKLRVLHKLSGVCGASRVVTILLVLIALLAAAIAAPAALYFRSEWLKTECIQSLDSGTRQLYDAYIAGDVKDAQSAKEVVTYAMNGWDDLCPGGGEVYLIEDPNQPDKPYRLVCGMHGSDSKERTRLNSQNVFDKLKAELEALREDGNIYPESVVLKLNGKKITVNLVDEDCGLRRGTATIHGYSGTVAVYALAGHSDFGSGAGLEDGEIFYFAFADNDHGAYWYSTTGWSGDCFELQ